jgi:astacin
MTTFDLPYEYGSNMHYGAMSFTINDTVGIVANNPYYQYTMGGEYFPSFLDILKINMLYNFTSTVYKVDWISGLIYFFICSGNCASATIVCQYGGYPDPKNCAICRCPYGFAGKTCTQLQPPTFGGFCNGAVLIGNDNYQTLSGYAGNASLNAISMFWPGLIANKSIYDYDCFYHITVSNRSLC